MTERAPTMREMRVILENMIVGSFVRKNRLVIRALGLRLRR